jgi:uncharacterized membrane protein YbhN (UPF0104 family)
MRISRLAFLTGGALALLLLVGHVGPGVIVSALARIAWWQLLLVCLLHGLTVVLDTLGWRCTMVGQRPALPRLLAVRCAGQAMNVVTAVGGVGGEAVKAWLLRRDVPYEASVPSLILAKTAEITGQALLLLTGLLVAASTGAGGWSLLAPMGSLLGIEVLCIGGFVLCQVTGAIGQAGRLLAWVGIGGPRGTQQLDRAIRRFYRAEWPALLRAVSLHYAGWLVGILEALLVLQALHVPGTLATATVVEALGSGVRFVTFFVPANLGTLEGANAAAFAALGWTAGDGLAFRLVRRGRQAVWVGLGLALLAVLGAGRAAEPGLPAGDHEPAAGDQAVTSSSRPARSWIRARSRSRAAAVSSDTRTGSR